MQEDQGEMLSLEGIEEKERGEEWVLSWTIPHTHTLPTFTTHITQSRFGWQLRGAPPFLLRKRQR